MYVSPTTHARALTYYTRTCTHLLHKHVHSHTLSRTCEQVRGKYALAAENEGEMREWRRLLLKHQGFDIDCAQSPTTAPAPTAGAGLAWQSRPPPTSRPVEPLPLPYFAHKHLIIRTLCIYSVLFSALYADSLLVYFVLFTAL